MQGRSGRGPSAAIAALVVALGLVVAACGSQEKSTTRSEPPSRVSPLAQDAAGVIQRQLDAHDAHFTASYTDSKGKPATSPDYGLTLDGVIAMDSAGVGRQTAQRATAYVADHIGEYIGTGKEKYAGATAKALLVSLLQALSPKGSLGGVDLTTRLESLESTSGPASGRFSDVSQYGDNSNTIGQSLALVSLKRAGRTLTPESTGYLDQQQCPGGGFRLAMADTRCTTAAQADTDATSYAVQGLLAEPRTGARADRIDQAIGYLKRQMDRSGGVPGGSPKGGLNANSTGLATMSLDSTGNKTSVAKGRSYLTSLRFGCSFPVPLRGAVALDRARLAKATSRGKKAKLADQDRRATAQAVLGFSGRSLLAITGAGAQRGSPPVTC